MLQAGKQEIPLWEQEIQFGEQELQQEDQADMALTVAYLSKQKICDTFWSRLRNHSRKINRSTLLN